MRKTPRDNTEEIKLATPEENPAPVLIDGAKFFEQLPSEQQDQILETIAKSPVFRGRFYDMLVQANAFQLDSGLPEATSYIHFLPLYPLCMYNE